MFVDAVTHKKIFFVVEGAGGLTSIVGAFTENNFPGKSYFFNL